MKSLAGLARIALLAGAASVLSSSGCQQEAGFECGRQVPGTTTVRACDRALEVCVCATNSCAVKVGLLPQDRQGDAGGPSIVAGGGEAAQWGDCLGPGEAGYRYAEAPYAREDLAGKCVRAVDVRLDKLTYTKAPACPGQVPPAEPTGGTAGAGGTGGSAGTGGASGASGAGGDRAAGAGGMGGEAGTGVAGQGGMSMGGSGGMSPGGENGAGMSNGGVQ
jgi:hypothetical protein